MDASAISKIRFVLFIRTETLVSEHFLASGKNKWDVYSHLRLLAQLRESTDCN